MKEINFIDAMEHVFGKENVLVINTPKKAALLQQAEDRANRKPLQAKTIDLVSQARLIEALTKFIAGAQKIVNASLKRNGFNWKEPISIYADGPKYIKIVVDHHGQKSAYCWIDKTNGNVLKGSWKAPETKNPRSNIFDDDNGVSGVDWHGAKYLNALKKK